MSLGKSGLIRDVTLGESGLIRDVALGEWSYTKGSTALHFKIKSV